MNLTHEVLVIAVDSPLLQRLLVLEEMRRRHVLQLELVDEGHEEGIDIPLRNFMKKKTARNPKRNNCSVLMNFMCLTHECCMLINFVLLKYS